MDSLRVSSLSEDAGVTSNFAETLVSVGDSEMIVPGGVAESNVPFDPPVVSNFVVVVRSV